MAPPPDLTVSEWADENRVLSSEASAEPGKWRTDRAPYQRGIMDSLNEKGIHTVVIMSSAQVGKSEFILNMIGYYIDQDPSPIMLMNPSLAMSEAFSKDRIDTMIRDTPCLRDKVQDRKSRDSGNTILHKKFPGGHLTLVGGNSPASMAARPIRIFLVDELSRLPLSAGEEGDPYSLGKKRTRTFHNRVVVAVSTPTVKGLDRTEDLYLNESDRRRYYVPCPHCGEMQPLEWAGIKWEKGSPEKVWYECAGCEERIEETEKFKMLKAGRWIAEGESDGVAGFHLNELYSPWSSWKSVVADFLAMKDKPDTLKVWVNTSLGETFEETGDGIEADSLLSRCEPYPAEVPDDVLFLTAAVDVQSSPSRLEVQIEGWGLGEENWKIAHYVLYGDLDMGEIWDHHLDDLLVRGTWENRHGRPFRVMAATVDSGGHHTQRVYNYVYKRPGQRIFAIKGRGGAGLPMVSAPSKVRLPAGGFIYLYTLGVDGIKTLTHNRLSNITEEGPGFVHFPIRPEFNEEYFEQLTAEKVKRVIKAGVATRKWVKRRDRNEAFDLSVYNYAALLLLNPKWDAIAERAAKQNDDTQEKALQISRNPRRRPAKKRGGFVNKWKR